MFGLKYTCWNAVCDDWLRRFLFCNTTAIPSTSLHEHQVINVQCRGDITHLVEMSISYVAYDPYTCEHISGLQECYASANTPSLGRYEVKQVTKALWCSDDRASFPHLAQLKVSGHKRWSVNVQPPKSYKSYVYDVLCWSVTSLQNEQH